MNANNNKYKTDDRRRRRANNWRSQKIGFFILLQISRESIICATWAANWFSSRIKTGVPLFWPILRARDYYYHRQSLWLLIFIASQSINTFNTIIDWKHFSNERRIADNIDNNWYGINLWFTAANVCLTSYQNTFVTQKTRHISSRCACDADEQPRISSIFK